MVEQLKQSNADSSSSSSSSSSSITSSGSAEELYGSWSSYAGKVIATGTATPTKSFDSWLTSEIAMLEQTYPKNSRPDRRRRQAAKRAGARSHVARVARNAISEAIKAESVLADAAMQREAVEERQAAIKQHQELHKMRSGGGSSAKPASEFGIDAVLAEAKSWVDAAPKPHMTRFGRLPSGFDSEPIEALIEKRQRARQHKHYSEADRLQSRIQRMGVKLDDRRRTWSVVKGWKKMQDRLAAEEAQSWRLAQSQQNQRE